jgi:Cell division protein FtsI/penicillin-binding protein 2
MNNTIFKRLAMLYKYGFVLLAIAVLGRIIYLQYINPTEVSSEDISFREENIEAIRGDIMARDGRPMAISVPYYQIRMDLIVPNKDTFDNNIDELSEALANFTRINLQKVTSKNY